MKYFKSLLLGLTLSYGVVQAQDATKNLVQSHKSLVKQALRYGDAQTAINHMHSIINLEGETSVYKDSLLITYFKIGNYTSSYLLSQELLTNKSDDLSLLEMNAVSLQKLGAHKEAILAYERLFTKSKNMWHGYQLANLQYDIKRLEEANLTVNQTLECQVLETAHLQFPIDASNYQNVPIKAAALNLKGLIAFELKDNDSAKNAFSKALEIMPDFAIANKNIQALEVANNSKN